MLLHATSKPEKRWLDANTLRRGYRQKLCIASSSMSRRLSAPQGLGWVRESGVQPVQVMILCIPLWPESNLKFSLLVTEEVINEERDNSILLYK